MDPISLLATTGTLMNIVGILGKTITTVIDLRTQWQDADLTVLMLESQLLALKSALDRIREWCESQFEDPHHQLVMDLGRCVACCRLLITKIDSDVSQATKTSAGPRLDAQSKFKLLLNTKEFEKTQHMIEQQTAALTLLLTACNTTMISRQKGLLEKPQTRRVFKVMESDTASLFVHRDVDSMLSYSTSASITSSKRSLRFDFDRQLLITRIYDTWIRGSVKKTLRAQQPPRRSTDPEIKSLERSYSGISASASFTDLDRSPTTSSSNTSNSSYAESTSSVSSRIRWDKFRSIPSRKNSALCDSSPKRDARKRDYDYKGLVMGSDSRHDILSTIQQQHPDNVATDPGPTEEFTGISQTRLQLGVLSIQLFDMGNLSGEKETWLPNFKSATFIIFVVDLDDYDEGLPAMLRQFDTIFNSGWFVCTSVVLLMNKVDEFREKLVRRPLEDCYPDFQGGDDSRKATEYIIRQFTQLNRHRLLLCPCVTECGGASVLPSISAAIKEAILNDSLRQVLPMPSSTSTTASI